MASAKGMLLDTVGRWALREAQVAEVRDLGQRMHAIDLMSAALRTAVWTPGDKIQVLLPSRDVRTYTPMVWAVDRGITTIIGFDHGSGPGAAWVRSVKRGDVVRFVGPQRSVRRGARPVVLFGDETSFGVAAALARAAPAQPTVCVVEVGAAARGEVLAALGVTDVTAVERVTGDAHLAEVASAIARALERHPTAELVLTGRGQSIQAVRQRLRSAGARDRGSVKPYWAVGKTGLD